MRIERHKTAIRRTTLSRPVKLLLESGLLSLDTTFLDYGCGLGDDIRLLQRHGYHANGWDPFYAPDGPRTNHDIVNLGFVLNVIEHPEERADTLRDAFAIADKCLAVAVMPNIDANRPDGVPFRDGMVTNRTTFQRLYTQDQLSGLIKTALDIDPVSISPGIVLVFKSRVFQNSFRYRRLRGQRDGINLSAPVNTVVASQVDEIVVGHPNEWKEYLQMILERGRPPDVSESRLLQICVNSRINPDYAFERARLHLGIETIEKAAQRSKDAIVVLLAMSQFTSKMAFSHLPKEMQMDVRSLFGSYKNALAASREALMSIGDLTKRSETAHQAGAFVESGADFLLVNPEDVSDLPLTLRLYVELGSLFLGSPHEAQRIKIHLRSNKLTYYYDAQSVNLPVDFGRELAAKLDFDTRNISTYPCG